MEKVSFGGRTDPEPRRELFGINGIPATPENFRRFFESSFSGWTTSSPAPTAKFAAACRNSSAICSALPNPPMLGLLTGNIRLGAEIKLRRYGLWDFFETGGFADDSEDRNHIAAAALERGRRVLGENLQRRGNPGGGRHAA